MSNENSKCDLDKGEVECWCDDCTAYWEVLDIIDDVTESKEDAISLALKQTNYDIATVTKCVDAYEDTIGFTKLENN